jgi:hypothetical protein
VARDAADPAAKSKCAPMNALQLEIQKRHTLNWLIQGAAQHAGMTFHHLVRDELNKIDLNLVRVYDQYALINLLQYWQVEAKLLLGSPARFWARAATDSRHPFFSHPLFSKYGGALAQEARERGLERCKEKGLTRLPIVFSFQTVVVIEKLKVIETPQRTRLAELAKKTASEVWGIPGPRLDAELMSKIIIGKDVLPAGNLAGAAFRAGIVGLGGVIQRNGQLLVLARATNWQLLAKELVKGTAELICLHGLNQLDDATYESVLGVTDRIDLEPWMLQTGGELWRRLLRASPTAWSLQKY